MRQRPGNDQAQRKDEETGCNENLENLFDNKKAENPVQEQERVEAEEAIEDQEVDKTGEVAETEENLDLEEEEEDWHLYLSDSEDEKVNLITR
jgi:hypothetical protein